MKTKSILLAALLISQVAGAQSCLPEGIVFASQNQINCFRINYPGCTRIEGDMVICGSTITNLNGLNVLTSIGGSLEINCNDVLTNLSGLENLTSIGGDLDIQENIALTNLSALIHVTELGGNINLTGNLSLNSLSGLQGLTIIHGMLWVDFNDMLPSLNGLNNLSEVEGFVRIAANSALTDLEGLNALTHIGGSLVIGGMGHLGGIGNPQLHSLSALSNLQSMNGSLIIGFNNSLVSLSGLDNIQPGSILEISIFNNTLLTTCEVQSVCDYLGLPGSVVNITDNAPGCNSISEVVEACEMVAAEESFQTRGYSLNPNPCKDYLEVNILPDFKYTTASIVDINGHQVGKFQVREGRNSVNLVNLSNGTYFLILKGSGIRVKEKFVRFIGN